MDQALRLKFLKHRYSHQDRRTTGVDRIKFLTPKQPMELAQNLKAQNKANPVRRV